jgi:hypothetical protein
MGQHTDGLPSIRRRGALQSGVRPAAYVLSAASAVVVAIWGTVAHYGAGGLHVSPALAMPIDVAAAAAAPGPTAAAVRAIAPRTKSRPTATATATSAPHAAATHTAKPSAIDYTVLYTFDDGAAGHLSQGASANPKLSVLSANGGALRTVKHGGGSAIGFPPRCADPGGTACVRVILQTSGNVDALNPGRQRVRFGADIRMSGAQTSDGENVVQKGYATGGSEYKLQVDGEAGRPSCAVVGTASARIFLARSSVSIADGGWHTVSCDLHGGVLSVTVDGTVRGTVAVPKSTTISNDDGLRIGGKGKSANNDQFSGELDNVWVTVGP